MDNFGIFKLLNSFYDFMSKNKSPSDSGSLSTPAPKTEQENPSFSTDTGDNDDKNGNDTKKEPTTAPLQEKMLSTIKNHDDFIKRVMNNKKQ